MRVILLISYLKIIMKSTGGYYICIVNSAYQNISYEELIGELISRKLLCEQLQRENDELKISQIQLYEELAQMKRMIFGSRSERFVPSVSPQQTSLDLDVATVAPPPPAIETITYKRKKPESSHKVNTGRLPLPANLERVPIVIEPQEDVTGLQRIGEEITEELELKPGKFYVNQYIRPKYAKAGNEGVIIGELPSRPIEKGIPGPGLLSTIVIDKYADHIPCHRQIQRFDRLGMKIPASTMSEWISASCNLLSPLYDALKSEVLKQSYLQADETPIKVLDKDKKGATHRGYFWVYHAPLIKMVLFEYRPSRGGSGPTELLKDFKGYLQTDGYGVYDAFDNGTIELFHCMAHARRMFDEALDNDRVRAEYILGEMQQLYDVERQAKEEGMSYDQRYEIRQKKCLPVLKNIHGWMKENIMEVLPQSGIGKAIAYTLKRWEKLCFYTTNGQLEIDNNLVENAIRPVAIGRKNYLFAGSHHAAQRSAMLYSFIGTCKKRGVEPYGWLKEVLTKIQDQKANELRQLFPMNSSTGPP